MRHNPHPEEFIYKNKWTVMQHEKCYHRGKFKVLGKHGWVSVCKLVGEGEEGRGEGTSVGHDSGRGEVRAIHLLTIFKFFFSCSPAQLAEIRKRRGKETKWSSQFGYSLRVLVSSLMVKSWKLPTVKPKASLQVSFVRILLAPILRCNGLIIIVRWWTCS